MAESAFKGTVLEGRERRYTIINERDLRKYADHDAEMNLSRVFNEAARQIEKGRVKDGKHPYNSYIVINVDEPYVDEIIEIMKRNGHWENGK